jgi:hypothetical protein
MLGVRLEVLSVWILLDRYVHSTRYEDEVDRQGVVFLHCPKSVFYKSYIPIIIILLPLTSHPIIILEHTMSYDFIHVRVSKVVKRGNAEVSSHWHVLHITLRVLFTSVISFEHQYLHQVHLAQYRSLQISKPFFPPSPKNPSSTHLTFPLSAASFTCPTSSSSPSSSS